MFKKLDIQFKNYIFHFRGKFIIDNEPFKLVTKSQTNFELEKSLRFITDIQYHGNQTFSCILNENHNLRTNFTVMVGKITKQNKAENICR